MYFTTSRKVLRLPIITFAFATLAACGSSSSDNKQGETLDVANIKIATKYTANETLGQITLNKLNSSSYVGDGYSESPLPLQLNDQLSYKIEDMDEHLIKLEFSDTDYPVLIALKASQTGLFFHDRNLNPSEYWPEIPTKNYYRLLDHHDSILDEDIYIISLLEKKIDYTLTIAKPNRELVDMAENDYFANISMGPNITVGDNCYVGDHRDADTIEMQLTINWDKGYIKYDEKQFKITKSDQENMEIDFTLDFDFTDDEGVRLKNQFGITKLRLIDPTAETPYHTLKGSFDGDQLEGDETCRLSGTVKGELLF